MNEHEHRQLVPHPDLPQRTVVDVDADQVTLSCGHVLAREPRLDRHPWSVGDKFGCHDCAMEGRE